MKIINKIGLEEFLFVIIISIITTILTFMPTHLNYRQNKPGSLEARCLVLDTDNSMVFQKGIFKMGEQSVKIRILDGPDRGRETLAMNLLQGALELEWFFQPGDRAIIGYAKDGNLIIAARILEPLREWPMLTIFLCILRRSTLPVRLGRSESDDFLRLYDNGHLETVNSI